MNIQEVFNTVIEADLYNEKNDLMCISLMVAWNQGLITNESFKEARSQIKEYLSGFGSLGGYLDFKKADYSFSCKLEIYQNWESRPFQKGI